MSTFISGRRHQVLKSEKDLAGYFELWMKPKDGLLLGLEAEFLGVNRDNGRALSYEGPCGIEEILKKIAKAFNYQPILDESRVIALTQNKMIIGLEPGGQLELSAPPVSTVFEVEKQVQNFLGILRQTETLCPHVKWLAAGIQPFSALEEISWVPKTRYRIMSEYMGAHGTLSHQMMKRTATNQLNLDYTGETDAMDKLRTAFLTTSIISALFANSSFSDGKLNGYATYRLEIWNHTSPERSGLIETLMAGGKHFSDYLGYVLQMPIIFIVRDGQWIPLGKITFRDFIKNGYQGTQASLEDFELHLSTAFPEARLKQYLEVRGADCQSPDLIPAVAALWKGILYDDEARLKAQTLVSFASPKEIIQFHREVPLRGLQSRLAGHPVLPLAAELVSIARSGLLRQRKNPTNADETVFLDRIVRKILEPKKSPGEQFADQIENSGNFTPSAVIQSLGI